MKASGLLVPITASQHALGLAVVADDSRHRERAERQRVQEVLVEPVRHVVEFQDQAEVRDRGGRDGESRHLILHRRADPRPRTVGPDDEVEAPAGYLPGAQVEVVNSRVEHEVDQIEVPLLGHGHQRPGDVATGADPPRFLPQIHRAPPVPDATKPGHVSVELVHGTDMPDGAQTMAGDVDRVRAIRVEALRAAGVGLPSNTV